MAVEERKQSRRFFNISKGTFVVRIRSEQDAPEGFKVVSRVLEKGPNKGNTVLEAITEGSLVGTISKIEFEKTEGYGENLIITFDDGDVLTMKTSSGPGLAFLKMYPNIDISSAVKFSTSESSFVNKGEEVTTNSLFIEQNGVNIKWAYTKDNPNGIPSVKKAIVNGEEVSDKTDVISFLKSNVKSAVTKTSNTSSSDIDDINPDDIPF